ncbi:hypothetical protein OKW21_006099 [Catalinimonas alkaloidigena]|uniref:DUF3299 domain-containing protein n=1 Tax=Catalinimonas alkaloidigena TaxID=1075417 RepID=UPI002404D85E|nr:DUF3299 domain-containing protein [Catalinimonas alkaloidigena]MDF9800836.1 hypothetical protein [Catalinimonas alkaloidigena]
MRTKMIIVMMFMFSTIHVFSQSKINWRVLANIEYVERYVAAEDFYGYLPEFSDELKALEGKEVSIKGFMLPIDPDNNMFLLSQNPFASCFFCGGGGPESVVELNLKPGHPNFRMDQVVTMKGKLRLNNEDFEQMMYILDEAEVVEIPEY